MAKSPKRQLYHHGNLPAELLEKANDILKSHGLADLTLRGISREAGVSHTAARHHFVDLVGLLSELAAIGFDRLRKSMVHAVKRDKRPLALGLAYVSFALENPNLFRLMFQDQRTDHQNVNLQKAINATIEYLADSLGLSLPDVSAHSLPLAASASLGSRWGLVHGLATLLIDGRLNRVIKLSPKGTDDMTYVEAALHGVFAPPAQTK